MQAFFASKCIFFLIPRKLRRSRGANRRSRKKKNVPAGKFLAGTFFFSGRELHAFLRRRDAASASANAPAIKPNADGSGMTNPPCSEEKLPV